jgi:hypothetical protein
MWHDHGMARIRISTTVDEHKLAAARELHGGRDAPLLDAALDALVAAHRDAVIEAAYAAYDRQPIDELDAWGNLAAFRDQAARS